MIRLKARITKEALDREDRVETFHAIRKDYNLLTNSEGMFDTEADYLWFLLKWKDKLIIDRVDKDLI